MRKFKVGDRVVNTSDHNAGDGIEDGDVFVVIDVEDDSIFFIDRDGDKRQRPSNLYTLHNVRSESSDPINHPAHYAGLNGIECIDAMRATLTPDEFRGYCKGAAFKYIWRERQKGGNESLAKAVWYLNEAQK